MKASDFFFKVGCTAWLLAVGGAALILVMGWLGAIDAAQFEWRHFGVVFGAGGLAAMIIGGVCSIWEGQG